MLEPKQHVVFLGDIHGQFQTARYKMNRANLENTYVIQCGDFGIGFYKEGYYKAELSELNEFLVRKNIFFYALRGNHDDPKWFDGTRPFGLSNIILLKDYTYLNIDGLNILCVGGATSIDRKDREIGKTYWLDEIFNLDDSKLSPSKIDVVACHLNPRQSGMFTDLHKIRFYLDHDKNLKVDLSKERDDISKLYDLTQPKVWVHGHYHESHTSNEQGTLFKSLEIDELWQLPQI